VRQLLGNPGGLFSVEKFYARLKSLGIAIARDTLHALLGYVEDCFLVRTAWVEADFNRRRMVNPRKIHPVDPGLFPIFDQTGRANRGQVYPRSTTHGLRVLARRMSMRCTPSTKRLSISAILAYARLFASPGNGVSIGVGRRSSRRTHGELEFMQSNASTKSNRTPEVEPAIRHTVPWRVTAVTALPQARLRVFFVDGTSGEVEMGVFLRNPALDGTLFEALRDPALFAQARVVLGAVQWPNGADLAPEAMYDAVREQGVWNMRLWKPGIFL
jgi:hypothetical protein